MFQTYSSPQHREAGIEQPRTVRAAVRVMYAGAGLSAAAIVFLLTSASRIRDVIADRYPRDTPLQVHGIEMETLALFIALQAVAVIMWVWMARANARGRNWARAVSGGLFGIWTVYALLALTRPREIHGLVIIGVIWLTGLAATVLIFLRESADYYYYSRYSPP